MYLLELSKRFSAIARQEAISVLNQNSFSILDNYMLLNVFSKDFSRLAMTNNVYKLLFQTTEKKLHSDMKSFSWNSIYKKDFSVRIISDKKTDFSEREFASIVWKRLKKPKVSLKNSSTQIVVIFLKNKIFVTLKIHENKENFEHRRSHLRPRPSPVSLHPKLARAMVNISGAKKGETILDPFSGSGGILIEAGLVGLKPIGKDINKKMIWKCMVNLKHYGLDNKSLEIKNFFSIKRKYNFIVTDLPYGLNASIMKNIRIDKKQREKTKKDIEEFYKKIFSHLEVILKKRAVIMVPDYVDYKKLLKKTKLKIKNEFSDYVHNNLTRKILILEPN